MWRWIGHGKNECSASSAASVRRALHWAMISRSWVRGSGSSSLDTLGLAGAGDPCSGGSGVRDGSEWSGDRDVARFVAVR